jgi:hypothetical protein
MKYVVAVLGLLFMLSSHAHLNHVQFAAIEEVDGQLRVRYRMSADMFMTNLDVEIKSGRLPESIKQLPLNEIIARYFQAHLLLETKGEKRAASSVTFTLDEKNGDWIADFLFPAPPNGAAAGLICDAFLENNPRTQTLARIDWRGEKDVFHFRKGSERLALAGNAAIQPSNGKASNESALERFVSGLANGLRAYDWLAAGALAMVVLRMIFKNREIALIGFVAAAGVGLGFKESAPSGHAGVAGFALAWLAVVLTAQQLISKLIFWRTADA